MTKVAGVGGYADAGGWLLLTDIWNPGTMVYGVDYTVAGSYDPADLTASTTFSWALPAQSPYSQQIIAYPDVMLGDSPWGRGTADPTDVFPIKVGSIGHLISTYNVAFGGDETGFDVAYDLWFTSGPDGSPNTISNELMIWLHTGGIRPYGEQVGSYYDSQFSGEIYHSGTYTAITSNTDTEAGTVDIGGMIAALTKLQILQPSEYLRSVQLGAEVASGTGSLTINELSLDVSTGSVNEIVTGTGVTVTTPATVSTLTATASSTPARQGQTIMFALATSEAVTVSIADGSPTLSLSNGGTANYDAADSIAGSLAFTTTIAAGQSSTDLQVTGLSLNGASISDSKGNGLSTVGVPSLPGADTGIAVSTATPTVVLGSGPDTLALNVVEDAYKGDAQFTVSVDGVQVGGIQTATALRGAGTTQTFDVDGSFGTGQHVVSVDFVNDLFAGTPSADRNLYVTSSTVDGQMIANGALTELSSGSQGIKFTAAPQATTLTLHLAEDAWHGNAAYGVTIDGKLLGKGTVTALNNLGQSQSATLQSILSAGRHDVGISFLNDAYGGTPSTDRNLYVKGIDVNGTAQAATSATLWSTGTTHFQVMIPKT